MSRLQELLGKLGPTPIKSFEASSELISWVVYAWDDLPLITADDGGMTTEKLHRAEDFAWDPPNLSFRIERHGAVVVGRSKKAAYQRWILDLHNVSKSWGSDGYKLTEPRETPVQTKPLAERYASLISNLGDDPALTYRSNEEVRVKTSLVSGLGANSSNGLPLARETVNGRRNRFRNQLKELLLPLGWVMVKPNIFHRI